MKRTPICLAKVRNLRKAGTVILAALLLLTSVALANGTPSVDWWVIGGGGGHADAVPHALDGTVGQPVVGVVSNDPYQLCSGFWCGGAVAAAPGMRRIYLPVILRNYP
jgi:hypothetical protein